MDSGDDNLFGPSGSTSATNTQKTTTTSQKANWFSGESFGETDTDDLFASLASRHSLSTETDQHAMQFDPFADNFPNSKGDKLDPFDTSTFTTTMTTTVNNSKETDLFERKSGNDFDDLLSFDPFSSSTTNDVKKSDTDQKVRLSMNYVLSFLQSSSFILLVALQALHIAWIVQRKQEQSGHGMARSNMCNPPNVVAIFSACLLFGLLC